MTRRAARGPSAPARKLAAARASIRTAHCRSTGARRRQKVRIDLRAQESRRNQRAQRVVLHLIAPARQEPALTRPSLPRDLGDAIPIEATPTTAIAGRPGTGPRRRRRRGPAIACAPARTGDTTRTSTVAPAASARPAGGPPAPRFVLVQNGRTRMAGRASGPPSTPPGPGWPLIRAARRPVSGYPRGRPPAAPRRHTRPGFELHPPRGHPDQGRNQKPRRPTGPARDEHIRRRMLTSCSSADGCRHPPTARSRAAARTAKHAPRTGAGRPRAPARGCPAVSGQADVPTCSHHTQRRTLVPTVWRPDRTHEPHETCPGAGQPPPPDGHRRHRSRALGPRRATVSPAGPAAFARRDEPSCAATAPMRAGTRSA